MERVEESRYLESASGKNANLKIQIYNLCQSQAAGGRMPGCDLVLVRARIPGQVRIGWAWSDLSALSWPGMRDCARCTFREHIHQPTHASTHARCAGRLDCICRVQPRLCEVTMGPRVKTSPRHHWARGK